MESARQQDEATAIALLKKILKELRDMRKYLKELERSVKNDVGT